MIKTTPVLSFPIAALWIAAPLLSGCDSPKSTAEASAPPELATPVAAVEEAEPAEPTPEADEPEAAEDPDPGAADPALVRIDRRSLFLGEPEHRQRHALATQPVAEIEKGRGGRSLAFKITLADGTVGYYKPEQTFSAAHWYAELAAYYLDRELGLGRVPPTVGRAMEWAPLREVAAGDERLDEIVVQEDGTVRGAFIWWVPGGLDPVPGGQNWERWVRVEGPLAVSPYLRPREWSRDARRFRNASEDVEAFVPSDAEEPVAGDPDIAERPAELSDMILFDYLATNVDRWGGNNTNVRSRGELGPLVYLDNGAGFTPGPQARIPLMDARLHGLQRFRRQTVERIRNLSFESYQRRMAQDPLAPILNERQMAQLRERHEHLLEHVADMEARFGDRAMAW